MKMKKTLFHLGSKVTFLDPQITFITSLLARGAPHPDRHHVRWGKPLRKNAFNGIRSDSHEFFKFSATQSPEKDFVERVNQNEGNL